MMAVVFSEEPWVVVEVPGNAYYRGERLWVGDTDIVKDFVAKMGIQNGGSSLGVVRIEWYPGRVDSKLVDTTESGAFAE
jgi:hypothetical protein